MRNEGVCFPSFFSVDDCKKIEELLQRDIVVDLKDKPATVVKQANTKIVPWAKAKMYLSPVEDLLTRVNASSFGFDIYKFNELNTVNYNVYDSKEEGQYDWHTDAMPTNPTMDIKLTVVISLSTEPYEGGDLEVFVNKPQAIKDLKVPGTVFIFPSYTQHRVTPVTKGVRKTLSFWIEGPNFR
jgi:PKHD-type hydroxylase